MKMFGLIKSPFNSERRLAALILIHEEKTKSQGRRKIKTSRVTEMLKVFNMSKRWPHPQILTQR